MLLSNRLDKLSKCLPILEMYLADTESRSGSESGGAEQLLRQRRPWGEGVVEPPPPSLPWLLAADHCSPGVAVRGAGLADSCTVITTPLAEAPCTIRAYLLAGLG